MAIVDNSRYLSSFYRLILLPANLRQLEIPRNFIKKYGKDLLDKVSLRILTTGATWEVKLKLSENGDTVWLQNGWPEFVEFYSIYFAYFLLFKYKGGSRFDVFIMDTSTSEIKYPVCAVGTKPSLKRRMETTDFSKFPTLCSSKKDGRSTFSFWTEQLATAPKKIYRFRCDLTLNEKKRVEDYSTNDPSFVVKIKPSSSFIHPNPEMVVPVEFAKKYLKNHDLLNLVSVVKEKIWSVKCVVRDDGRVKLTKGWSDFATDNQLRADDICIFEMIKTDKKTLKVGVLPANSVFS